MKSDPDTTRSLYEKAVATQPDLVIKGKTSAYTSMNGHMFSFLTKEGPLALRLSPDEHDAFMKKHKTSPVIQHGSVMRGYVLIPPTLLKRAAEMKKYFASSVKYIASLEPKPTNKSKKKPASKKVAKKTARKVSKKAAKKAPSKKAPTKKSPTKKGTQKKASTKKSKKKKSSR